MFIKNKSQKERVNTSLCTNYYPYDYKKFIKGHSDNGIESEDYRIIFMFSPLSSDGDDCVIWIFPTWQERDEELKRLDSILDV